VHFQPINLHFQELVLIAFPSAFSTSRRKHLAIKKFWIKRYPSAAVNLIGIERVIYVRLMHSRRYVLKLVVFARLKAWAALSNSRGIPETNVGSVLRALGFSFFLGLSVMGATGLTQAQTLSGPKADSGLPLGPSNGAAFQEAGQRLDLGQSSASISGVVLDPSGAVVRGSTVKLTGGNDAIERTAAADDQGRFTFLLCLRAYSG
jgi:hypothetical protein